MSEQTGLPPIYADTPIAPVPHKIVASLPVNSFLESIAVAADGTLFITNHEVGQIIRIFPHQEPRVFATVAGKTAGVALTPAAELLITGWDSQGNCVIWGLTPDGNLTNRATLPDAQFLNGITPLTDDQYLIADSYRGVIWGFEAATNQVSIWLEHPLLARSSPENPFPGANGLKRFGDTLYVSNTERMLLLKIPIQADNQPGEPSIFVEPTNLDDFAFDREGNLYATTHIYNSVVKIAPSGATTIIAQVEQGIVGSTALAFGRLADDATSVYVVMNGGMSMPLPEGLVPAHVVRLEVGQTGYSLNGV